MNQKRQREDFTDEFKNDAARRVTEQGDSCDEVGRRPPHMVTWCPGRS